MTLALLMLAGEWCARAPGWAAAAPGAAEAVRGHDGVGVVVGVIHDGRRQVYGFGTVRTPAGRHAPDGRTIFEIGSITKAVTGVLLADAVNRGEVRLDAPVNESLPADLQLRSHAKGPITALDLATHRGGLPVQPFDIVLGAADPENAYASYTRARLGKLLSILKPAAPNAKEVYSNLGAGVLGHALAHAAKAASYGELVRARIAGPLGLRDFTDALDGEQRARLAPGHADGKPTAPWDFASLGGCGCLRASADDLLAFASANLGDGPPGLVAACRESHTSRRGRLGLFWHHLELEPAAALADAAGDVFWAGVLRQPKLPRAGTDAVWHNGGTYGYRAMLVVAPSRKLAVVVLCNNHAATRADRIDAIALTVAERLTGAK